MPRDTQDNTLEGIILDILEEHLRYHKSYVGRVVNNIDPLAKGRILATVADLGWDTPDVGVWCFPRYTNALTTPAVGKYIEVSFINGDMNWPTYHGVAAELEFATPSTWLKNPQSHIIFESPLLPKGIRFNDISGLLEIDYGAGGLNLGNAPVQPFVRGTDLLTYLTSLVSAINTFITTIYNLHTHAGVTPGGSVTAVPVPIGVSVPTPTAALLSTNIRGE